MARVLAKHALAFFKLTDNVRQFSDPEADKVLLESLKRYGQLTPIFARPCGTLVDGYRRIRLMPEAGIEVAEALITDEDMTAEEVQDFMVVNSNVREKIIDNDIFKVATRRIQQDESLTAKELAAKFCMDASKLSRILSLAGCIEEVQQAAASGEITNSFWSILSGKSPEKQLKLLDMKRKGASRDAIRKAAISTKPTATSGPGRERRLVIPVPGAVVTIAAPELTWAKFKAAMTEVGRASTRACDVDQVSLHTFAQAMRDKHGDKPKAAEGPS